MKSTPVRISNEIVDRYAAVHRAEAYHNNGDAPTPREMMEADMLPGLQRREKAEGIK